MSDRREQVAESPRLGYGMSVTDPGVGRSAFVRETNQSRLVCAIRKLIICRTVATAPHVYARRAPSFWSSAVVKASVTCRVWAITSSRTALRSFSVRPSGAQASTSSISCARSATISAVRDSRSFSFSRWWLEFTKVFIHCGMDWAAFLMVVGGARAEDDEDRKGLLDARPEAIQGRW